MHKLITKYGQAAHLALLAVAPLFLSPMPTLWLAALAVMWLFLEPSRFGAERLHDAQRRVIKSAVTDPLFWLMLVVVAIVGVRWYNTGVALAYDSEQAAWSLSSGPFALLPATAKGHGAAEFAAVCAMAVILQGLRHALGKSARLAFLLIASSISAVVGLVMIYRLANGDAEMMRWAECALLRPVFIGAVFGCFLMSALVGLLAAFERSWFRAMAFASVGVAGNAAALFVFSPSWMLCGFAAATLILFLYVFFYARRHLSSAGEFRYTVVLGISLTLAWVVVVSALSSKAISLRVEPFLTGEFFSQAYFNMRDVLSVISRKAWTANPWIGSGLGTFTLDLSFNAQPSDWEIVQPDQQMALNGYWHLMVERGIIGAFLFLVPLGFLLWTYFKMLFKGVFCHEWFHPACFLGFLALAVIVAETFFDATFALTAYPLVVASLMAVSASSFPKERHNG